jgi:hypothetical protein
MVWPEEAGRGAVPGEHGERGLGTEPAGVGPGVEDLAGGDGPDAGFGDELGRGVVDEQLELGFQVVGLGSQDLDAASGGSQGSHGGPVLDAVFGHDPQAGATLDLDLDGIVAELVAQLGGCVDDQRLKVAQRPAASPYGASRVHNSTRMASRVPRRRGWARWSRARASRAAR